MEMKTVHTVNLRGVLSESKRILKSNYWHFFALSLFFLPLSLSLVVSPTLHPQFSGNFYTADLSHKLPPNYQNVIIFRLLYILTVYLLALCATGTISYSTYRVLIGKPVNYLAALKSLTLSFFPLIATTILAQILLFFISITFLLFVGVIIMLGKSLGLVFDFNWTSFMWFSIVIGVMLILILIYFQMNWCLTLMVVVAESKWGFAALSRSWYLVRGIRSVSLSLLLYYSIGYGLLAWVSSRTVYDNQNSVFFTILGSFFLMMCLLAITTANAVLYMYGKAFHGELELEIAEGFDYINLSSDHQKVPLIVTVVEV
ncbi:hypothetical protein LXL04_021093 [Taraxacum kok-saghyz]